MYLSPPSQLPVVHGREVSSAFSFLTLRVRVMHVTIIIRYNYYGNIFRYLGCGKGISSLDEFDHNVVVIRRVSL